MPRQLGLSSRERTRLLKKMRRLEKKFEKANPNAQLAKERLMRAAEAVQRRLS